MKLRTLSADSIQALTRALFGVDAQVKDFMSGEIAVNVELTNARLADATQPSQAESSQAEPPTAGPTPPGHLVLKAESPSSTMTPEHADWICTVQDAAHRAGVPVAAQITASAPYQAAAGTSSGCLAYAPPPAGSESVLWRLQEFLTGQVAATAEVPADYPAQVGELAARVAVALAAVDTEPLPVFHPWAFELTGANVQFAIERIRTLEASGYLATSQTAAELGLDTTMLTQDLVLAGRIAEEFEKRVRPLAEAGPQQVVHQDLNDFNILLENGSIVGLLDFGDARTAPRMAEIAIAAAYTMLGAAQPLENVDEAVSAYNRAAAGTASELEAAEVALVRLAATARLCLNACTWTARSIAANPNDPQTQYGQARMARTWPVVRAVAPQVLEELTA